MCHLIQKYNVPGPRYTSYPTVPHWNTEEFSGKKWMTTVQRSFEESNTDGISLYIHLPFCESLCTFCGCHKRITKRHSVEVPYVMSVLKEWKLYCKAFSEKPRIKQLHLGGGTPTFFSMVNLSMLIKGLFETAERTEHFEYSFEGHPNNTTYEQLEGLYELGFTRVSFGVQDYNPTVQKAINRIQPFENVKRVTEWAKHIGYTSVGHDIIFGLPHQTQEHVRHTIAKTKELLPDRLAFYSYAHTPWLKGNGQRGYKEEDLPSAQEKRNQYELGKALLLEQGYKEIGMDHFALETDSLYTAMKNGSLHRNFMGYTESKTQLMIGLGLSSISDSWYGFAQNVKSLEEYQHLVDNHIIPIYRGHILSEEDQLVRKHILNLMCRMQTSWTDQEAPLLSASQERLRGMEEDGLVVLSPKSVRITEKGRPFVRNVCMAFDQYLQRQSPNTRVFSMTV
ncbi:oxygen-independent coproporphyrinogen III oxidase [Pseudozobellia thermophila]|uniref:Coproporphyrinogen-III oxidase n=1 Tax=Pseudozobellia thermophila TaxID=192903 RepID=A0A1M6L672_9FLAO|nr:oxygen-independent coproporphyrinogen III oxidase [Pseudozobellia thermophila]SHJ66723.1 oxygen-independent coproporphyrinogen-3 oxidase [Pseudozobellia thermophila]